MTRSLHWYALVAGLVCSGVAGIVNQVVWQRALKVVLGGSETLSSMIVVLVFLGGLGLGSALAARRAAGATNPMAVLAMVELGLALVNAVVAMVLGLDISETVYAVQRLAVGLGVPLRVVYALGASVCLLPPTLLMGATIPLASEAAQRQLGARDRSLVPVLFFVNTAGAALGALVASLWWLPWWGQRAALFGAIALNALAAFWIGVLGRSPSVPGRPPSSETQLSRPYTREEVLGAALGFVSLGYEMLLFRALSLSHGPLPGTFALGLTAFLVAWATGVALSARLRVAEMVLALVTAMTVALAPAVLVWDRARHSGDYGDLSSLLPAVFLYAVPVVGFGWLYGCLVSRRAEDWGRDVGRYAALNTLGSCAGVLAFTLGVYELPLAAGTTLVASVLVVVAGVEGAAESGAGAARLMGDGGAAMKRNPLAVGISVVGVLAALTAVCWGATQRVQRMADGTRTYWGSDGVVEVHPDGDVMLDGLWHTRLTDGPDGHVGRPYTWVMAAAAVLAHPDPHPQRALVIGAGVGVSGVTLAGVDGLQVDGYEINRTLKRLLVDMPEQTLGALEHEQLRWIWQDARTGLALDETRYDIILSAPLHLRQAGSSLLLSREYLRLVKSRLADGGVVAVYSNEGPGAQTLLVQATLAEAFAYRTSWYDGIVTVASDRPIEITPELLASRMQRSDLLYRQMRDLDASLAADGGVFGLWDGDTYTRVTGDRVIVDDWPLVEHPEVASQLVREQTVAK